MDQLIFDRLDQLERGARIEPRSARNERYDSSAEYLAYNGQGYAHGDEYRLPHTESVSQPAMLDSFGEEPSGDGQRNYRLHAGEQPVRRSDRGIYYGEAPLNRPRLPTVPDEIQALLPVRRGEGRGASGFDLPRFALDAAHHNASDSSLYDRPVPSSPTFEASQRRPGEHEYASTRNRHHPHRAAMESFRHPGHRTVTSRLLQEEEEHQMSSSSPDRSATFRPDYLASGPIAKSKNSGTGLPIVQGISLVSTHQIPDRFRSIFPFPLFNAVQSKSFATIYQTNDNFVLSAPTGSGKTAVLELAVCRLINGFANGSFKIIYQAPTKSLCSERQRDWQSKFGPLDLQCAELTGDSDHAQLRNVQHATIIITTPEKWDSMTRKWKDHQKLMQMVKLFLIDEVHMLKDDRGATLEAVVSRMKSVGSNVRFVALSATVPNSGDIAKWLGKDDVNAHLPATRERFGEEFRPVRLQKHVIGYQSNSNDFAFEKLLSTKLPEVIAKWSQRKPMMVFCFTRSACVETAKTLANWWATKGPRDRYWGGPKRMTRVSDKDLRDTIPSGVAFHHAGLQIQDRAAVEKGYLEGDIKVICCTSTLAVGVNLPCHMVIIKNTVAYQNATAGGCKEYSDIEVMQMLGRAGRPQFDDSAVAVIMTRPQRVQQYEKMISGQELLESCLHRNLIDHLNAEIGLGTITSASSAKNWLKGTFLYVRLKEHPEHYKLEGDAPGRNLDERLENICSKGIALLEESDLVRSIPKLQCTEFGDAMARYYLQFDTMRVFLALPPQAKISEILSAVSQAAEFRDIRFRAGEKSTYKDLNKNSSVKFSIPVNLDAPAHKVSLIIQSVLGAIELPTDDGKQRIEYSSCKASIFQHVHRLVRCIVDCQLYLDDAVATRNALMLARSLGAQVWDDSPLHMKQLESVGLVYVRKLAVAGIKSVEDIENAEPRRLEHILTRNPPYGAQLQSKAKAFPKLRISLKMVGDASLKKGEHVTIRIKADIGFLNEKVPETFQKRPVYVCMLAEVSDGRKMHFARISAKKLNNGQDVLFSANMTNANQTIRVYVMCDEIAGTSRSAILKPDISGVSFPPQTATQIGQQRLARAPNTTKDRTHASAPTAPAVADEFIDAALDDTDLVLAEDDGFVDIDEVDAKDKTGTSLPKKRKATAAIDHDDGWIPRQLPNGKWACNHVCKKKTECKHLCCREGLDKKPNHPKPKQQKTQEADEIPHARQTHLSAGSKKNASLVTSSKSLGDKTHSGRKLVESSERQSLDRLHNSGKGSTPKIPMLGVTASTTPKCAVPGQQKLSFLDTRRGMGDRPLESDYGNQSWDISDLPDPAALFDTRPDDHMSSPRKETNHPQDDGTDNAAYDIGMENELEQHLDERYGDGHIDLSSYTGDFVSDRQAGDDRLARFQNVTMSGAFSDVKGSGGLFVSDNAGSAGHGLPGELATDHERVGEPKRLLTHKETSTLLAAPTKQSTSSRTCPNQLPPGVNIVQPGVENAFRSAAFEDTAKEVEQSQPSSEDELKKWFEAEFGTERFNLTD